MISVAIFSLAVYGLLILHLYIKHDDDDINEANFHFKKCLSSYESVLTCTDTRR